jgi:hypothetical protein
MSAPQSRELIALRDLNRLVEAAQLILAEYLPGKLTANEAIAELLELLDGPEQRDIQGRAREVIKRVWYSEPGARQLEDRGSAL